MATGVSIWATFPAEDAFSRVLVHLVDRRDLASVNLVSRAWHAGLQRQLPFLGPLDFPSRQPVTLARQLELYTGVTDLALSVRIPCSLYSGLLYEHVFEALAAHPALRKLDFDDYTVDRASLRQLGSLTRLRDLHVAWRPQGLGREAWGAGTLLAFFSDLTGLTRLSLHSGGAQRDLEALRRMPLLQQLELEIHQEADLSPLSRLQHLNCVHIWEASPQSRQRFSLLTNLQGLDSFDIDQDTTVRYLSTLTGLTSLHLEQKDAVSNAVNLGAIQCMHRLKDLRLHLQIIADLKPLAALRQLETLVISSNYEEAYDVRPLAGLSLLKKLQYTGGELLHASCLGSLASLAHVHLDSEDITNLDWLCELARLRSVDLMHPPKAEYDFLAGLVGLTSVRLTAPDDSDMDNLVGLTSLQSVTISDGLITNAAFASGLLSLEHLVLYDAKDLTDISHLQALPALRNLEVTGCTAIDWSTLSGLTALTSLNISSTCFADITLLSCLTNLRYLDIGATPATRRGADIQRILPGLTTLLVYGPMGRPPLRA